MTYKISRDGQEFGPYTLQEVQRYVGEGSILQNDYVHNGIEWITVSQLLKEPNRGLAVANSITNAAHSVSRMHNTASSINHSGGISLSKKQGSNGCLTNILMVGGIIAIIQGLDHSSPMIVITGIIMIIISIIMICISCGTGSSGGSFHSGCSSSSSCSSCGGGCGGCGGGE